MHTVMDYADANLVYQHLRPLLEAGGAYILQSDHTIPPQVNFETMRYFFGRGRELSGEIMRKRR